MKHYPKTKAKGLAPKWAAYFPGSMDSWQDCGAN
jgi:hypothetical protein